MATYTTNLNLTKSLGTENYSIDIVNANLDKIDAGCVNTSTAQTVTGVKTFTATPIEEGPQINRVGLIRNTVMTVGTPANNCYNTIDFVDKNGSLTNFTRIAEITHGYNTTNNALELRAYNAYNQDNTFATIGSVCESDGTKYVYASYRTYNSSHTNDVVTIGTLKQSTDVVHTSGAEVKSGNLTLTDRLFCTAIGVGGRWYESLGGNIWRELFRIKCINTDRYVFTIKGSVNGANSACYGKLHLLVNGSGVPYVHWIYRYAALATNNFLLNSLWSVIKNDDNTMSLMYYAGQYSGIDIYVESAFEQASVLSPSTIQYRTQITTPNDLSTLEGTTHYEPTNMAAVTQ